MKYGIAGHPIENSLLPAMFKAAFQLEGNQSDYELFDIKPDDPEELANFCYETDLNEVAGFSVDTPYKELIMDYCDYFDPIAKKLGSVNVVKNEESNLNGYNTEVTGIVQALQEAGSPTGKKALVMGVGANARAAIYGLKEFGSEVFVLNREEAQAKTIAEDFEVDLIELEAIKAAEFDIIVNATPVGTSPHIEQTLLQASQIKKEAVVMDMVIDPLETELLKQAKKAGAKTISAERMLLHQAAGQYEVWFDKTAPFDTMEKALYEALKA